MTDTVAEKVIELLASVKHIPAASLSPDSMLADLGFDSLDTITVLFELESKFHISIPDEEARAIRSVRDVVEGVRKLIMASSAASPAPAPEQG
jgi:acyl carrier protein